MLKERQTLTSFLRAVYSHGVVANLLTLGYAVAQAIRVVAGIALLLCFVLQSAAAFGQDAKKIRMAYSAFSISF
jgi:hypothetical protein